MLKVLEVVILKNAMSSSFSKLEQTSPGLQVYLYLLLKYYNKPNLLLFQFSVAFFYLLTSLQVLYFLTGSQRAMVMIGDAIPHTVSDYKQIMSNYKFVKSVVDWRKESDELIGIVRFS